MINHFLKQTTDFHSMLTWIAANGDHISGLEDHDKLRFAVELQEALTKLKTAEMMLRDEVLDVLKLDVPVGKSRTKTLKKWALRVVVMRPEYASADEDCMQCEEDLGEMFDAVFVPKFDVSQTGYKALSEDQQKVADKYIKRKLGTTSVKLTKI